ncbi:hypothetical protein [Anaerocolumna jejuensis]|nr:hypothetical protein [Anaerocolumna jejuensis]
MVGALDGRSTGWQEHWIAGALDSRFTGWQMHWTTGTLNEGILDGRCTRW